MTASEDVETGACINHPKRETALRCSRCERFICTRCAIQTPVGSRCKDCARLRRLPQYDVDLLLLIRSVFAGLVVSVLAWSLVSYFIALRFILSILVGLAVGEVMSRFASRRDNPILEVSAVCNVIAGLLLSDALGPWAQAGFWHALTTSSALGFQLLLPAAVASYVAVVKLR